MVTEYLNSEFDQITTDVGQELKNTARRIYVRALWVFLVIAAIEFLFAVIASIAGDADPISIFLLIAAVGVGILIEFCVLRGILHVVTINMYAKGEIVHLLKNNGVRGTESNVAYTNSPVNTTYSPVTMQPVQPVQPAQPDKPQFVPKSGIWYCSRCGTENSQNHSQCKKCGTYLTGAIPEVQTKTANTPETVAPVWECAFCGTKNNSNTCVRCGKTQDERQQAKESWVCSKCNTVNSSKYTQCKNCAALRNGTSAQAWEDTTETLIADTWKCDNCGTRNSNKYGQCKKCGTYRA